MTPLYATRRCTHGRITAGTTVDVVDGIVEWLPAMEWVGQTTLPGDTLQLTETQPTIEPCPECRGVLFGVPS